MPLINTVIKIGSAGSLTRLRSGRAIIKVRFLTEARNFFKGHGPPFGPMQPPVCRVGYGYAGRSVQLITCLHLVPRLISREAVVYCTSVWYFLEWCWIRLGDCSYHLALQIARIFCFRPFTKPVTSVKATGKWKQKRGEGGQIRKQPLRCNGKGLGGARWRAGKNAGRRVAMMRGISCSFIYKALFFNSAITK